MALTCGFCLGEDSTQYDSAQFADAFHALVGDGISFYGSRFSLSVNGFTAAVSTGYALAAGRWIKNDEPLPIGLQPSGNNEDRTDALVIRADYEARHATLEVLVDIDPEKLKEDPSLLRGKETYSIILYFIRVRRGVTSLSPEDVTDLRADADLCGTIVPLSEVSSSALYIYQFLTSGIDQEVERLIDLSNQVIEKAGKAITELDSAIQAAGGTAEVGELLTSRKPPDPAEAWLLCDGGEVPVEYPALSEILQGILPKLSQNTNRYKTYIYAGLPAGG